MVKSMQGICLCLKSNNNYYFLRCCCIFRSCLYETNHPTQVRRLTWVRSRRNGVFHFVKTNVLYENGFIPTMWDPTSTQVRSHLDGMIFLYVNSFCRTAPSRRDCSFSLDSVCFCSYYVKKCNSSCKN